METTDTDTAPFTSVGPSVLPAGPGGTGVRRAGTATEEDRREVCRGIARTLAPALVLGMVAREPPRVAAPRTSTRAGRLLLAGPFERGRQV
jgi:hypothetical protein